MTGGVGPMKGKICLVTGASGDMGRVIARELAFRGAIVEMVCRTAERGQALKHEIVEATGNQRVDYLVADLSDQKAIRAMVAVFRQRHDRLHVLINNAGAHFTQRQLSVDGVELHLAINHLAPFLLTNLLKDALMAGAPSRVVNVASQAMANVSLDLDYLQSERSFKPMEVYGRSKLALLMTGYALARRLAETGVTVNALHPGIVATSIVNDVVPKYVKPFLGLFKAFMLSPEDGAKPAVHLATAPELTDVTGAYFVRMKQQRTSAASYDVQLQDRLWQASARLVSLESTA